MSASISEWLAEITDHRSSTVERLQDKYKHLLPSCFAPSKQARSDEMNILKVIGETDAAGNLEGEVEIFYENGDYFWGWYSHGVREGEGSLVENSGDHYLGKYSRGTLHGLVTETVDFSDFHNIRREVFYQAIFSYFYTSVLLNHTLQNGVRHGFYREFKHNNNFWSFGKFINGKKSGIHWTKVEGNAFLVGEVERENRPEGDSLYLYPDLCTAIQGQYHQGKLTSGGKKKIWWIFFWF